MSSYHDNNFYSLYGWRVQPPTGYPQSYIQGPDSYIYNINRCAGMCNGDRECMGRCRIDVIKRVMTHRKTLG